MTDTQMDIPIEMRLEMALDTLGIRSALSKMPPVSAVCVNGYALAYVPEGFKKKYPELCSVAVRQSGYAIQYVPPEIVTREMCLEAVKQRGRSLFFVPLEFRDAEMCLEAVKQCGSALRDVPSEIREQVPELYLLALKK